MVVPYIIVFLGASMTHDRMRSRDICVSFNVQPHQTQDTIETFVAEGKLDSKIAFDSRQHNTRWPKNKCSSDKNDYDRENKNSVGKRRRSSCISMVLQALKFVPAFDTSAEINDTEEQLGTDGSSNFEISENDFNQLDQEEFALLQELCSERQEAKWEKRRLGTLGTYPMLGMQQSTHGLMGGFALGCMTPIHSPLIEWKDLWFVLQDVLLLGLYGLAVGMLLLEVYKL